MRALVRQAQRRDAAQGGAVQAAQQCAYHSIDIRMRQLEVDRDCLAASVMPDDVQPERVAKQRSTVPPVVAREQDR